MTQIFESPTESAGNIGELALMVGRKPELFQARSCSPCQQFK